MTLGEILQFDFIQRSIIVGVLIGAVLALFSPLVILRRMAFFGGGLAHASLAGIAIGLAVGWQPLMIAIVFGMLLALFMEWLERRTKLASDTIIGIFFAASMSLGVVIISLSRGFQPDLVSFLFGNILSIQSVELIITAVLSFILIVFFVYYRQQLFLLAFDADTARLTGVKVAVLEIAFRMLLAVAVIIGVKVIGIVLVSALLVLPAATAKLLTGSLKALTTWTFVISEATIVIGLLVSFVLDWPSGATIILVGTVIFLITALVMRPLFKKS
ncbi:metal ABC transporter permease [Patescibacteria group bacterium]